MVWNHLYKYKKPFKNNYKIINTDYFINFKSIENNLYNKGCIKSFRLESFTDLRKKLFTNLIENRKLFKIFFLTKFVKRWRITKFVNRITRTSTVALLKFFDLSILNILVKTYFYTSYIDTHIAIINGLVFLNKKNCYNTFYTIRCNDVIELIYSKDYYIFIKKKT